MKVRLTGDSENSVLLTSDSLRKVLLKSNSLSRVLLDGLVNLSIPPVLISIILIDENTIELTYDKDLDESVIPALLDYYFDYSGQEYILTEESEYVLTEEGEYILTEESDSPSFSGCFLPSKDDLQLIYDNLVPSIIPAADWWWSSSEFSDTDAYYLDFNDGSWNNYGKITNELGIYPCRKFTDTGGAYIVGDFGQAGYIYRIDGNDFYEVIITVSLGNQWSNVAETVGTSTALGSGQSNTNLIIAQSGHTDSAAKICNDLTT